MAYKNTHTKNRGFTLVEMLIIAPIVILVIGIFVSAVISMTGAVLQSRGENALAYNINDALTRIDQDVKSGAGFLSVDNFTPIAGQGPNNDSDGTSFENATSTSSALIINSYATDQNPLTPTRNIINNANLPYACSSPSVNQNSNLMTNIVYFVNSGTLWRRVIMPNNYAAVGCATPWQKPTCTPGYNSVTYPFCAANDQRLVNGVTAFNVTYWNNSVPPTQITVASDYTQLDAARQTAMQTAASVNVTITAANTLDGKNVTQTGSIRSLGIQAPTMLTQPIPAVVTVGNPATFTTAANGANMTIKWEQSTDNGITWTTISGATSSQLTINSVVSTSDGYLYHVIYTNSYGQVTSSPARLTVNDTRGVWNALTLQNSWGYYGTPYNTAGYMKTSAGVVLLKGMISGGTATNGTILATLPVGYRPMIPLLFGTSTSSNVSGRIDVYPNGNIVIIAGSSSWISLDNIRFIADTGRYTSTPITQFYNGWTNYGYPVGTSYGGNGGWGNASYIVDSVGRVSLQGLLTPPATGRSSGARIFDLPSTLLPSNYMFIPGNGGGTGFAAIGINPALGSSAIVDQNLGTSYLTINAMYNPASVGSWTTLTFQNSWAYYGGNLSTPQYTKASDGLVTVKGMVSGGTTTAGTIIATLPSGYRPAGELLLAGYSNGAYARVDINTSGNILFEAGSNVWFSLDGITFYADGS